MRRTRNVAKQADALVSGMYLVGCFYNFCDYHHSLRLKLSVGSFGYRWVQRTPAIVAQLADPQWKPAELLHFKVPPHPGPCPVGAGDCPPPCFNSLNNGLHDHG